MSRRRLSNDEYALWKGYVRALTPLRRSRPVTEPSEASPAAPPAKVLRQESPRQAPQQPPPKSSPKSPPKSSPKSPPKSSPKSPPKSSPKSPPKSPPKSSPKSSPKSPPKSSPKSPPKSSPKPAPEPPPLAPFDRRLRQRVVRGRETIDARIDLHGMTQSQAHAALLRFLHRAHANDVRLVLVVTGKGVGKSAREVQSERGVLRRSVPMWLSLPEFRRFVVSFEEAHPNHGGQGALYLRMRRRAPMLKAQP